MSKHIDAPPTASDVGYKKPPSRTKFKKGKSGNPNGRPKKKEFGLEDLLKVLDSAVNITTDGKERKLSSREIELQVILKRALKDQHLPSIAYLLKNFKKYGLLPAPAVLENTGGVIMLPDSDETPYNFSVMLCAEFGRPPWSPKEVETLRPAYEEAMKVHLAEKKEALRKAILEKKYEK